MIRFHKTLENVNQPRLYKVGRPGFYQRLGTRWATENMKGLLRPWRYSMVLLAYTHQKF